MRKKFGFLLAAILCFAISLQAQKISRLKRVVSDREQKVYSLPMSVVKVPTGNFLMNTSTTTDTTSFAYRKPQSVLISSFYMSTTEVTNSQYKSFANWVRNSIAALDLGGEYITVKDGDTAINWNKVDKIKYSDPAVMAKLTNLTLDPSKSLSNHLQIDPDKLVYRMRGFDYAEAAKKENEGRNPKDFVYNYTIKVYPDTLVWMRDFGYSNNEYMAKSYFASPEYKNYPVVGVNWKQANAYCDWFTKQRIQKQEQEKHLAIGGICRLPTEAEWMYAASLNENKEGTDIKKTSRKKHGKKNGKDADENSSSLQNNKLFPEMVLKNKRGDYSLFGMAGNVSEWTNTSYYEGGANFLNRFNPDISWGKMDSQSKFKSRKVICGGSWKDTPAFTTINNHFYDDMDAAHSYIGFRVVVNFSN